MHPRYEVDKVYEVEVEGEPSDEALEGPAPKAVSSWTMGRRRLPRLSVVRLPLRELTLHEGRKHQVKRMFAAVEDTRSRGCIRSSLRGA